jgi:hypothetical protein
MAVTIDGFTSPHAKHMWYATSIQCIPSGAKARCCCCHCGTTKVVPFQYIHSSRASLFPVPCSSIPDLRPVQQRKHDHGRQRGSYRLQ